MAPILRRNLKKIPCGHQSINTGGNKKRLVKEYKLSVIT